MKNDYLFSICQKNNSTYVLEQLRDFKDNDKAESILNFYKNHPDRLLIDRDDDICKIGDSFYRYIGYKNRFNEKLDTCLEITLYEEINIDLWKRRAYRSAVNFLETNGANGKLTGAEKFLVKNIAEESFMRRLEYSVGDSERGILSGAAQAKRNEQLLEELSSYGFDIPRTIKLQ